MADRDEEVAASLVADYSGDELIESIAIELRQAREEGRQGAINTPELLDFSKAVVLEATHQRERWGTSHDAGKTDPDWFWLLGYLAGKALFACNTGNRDKALHHIITTAAACANWHAALMGQDNRMRPGIDPETRGING